MGKLRKQLKIASPMVVMDTPTDLKGFPDWDRPSEFERPGSRLRLAREDAWDWPLGNLRRDSRKTYSIVRPSAGIETIHAMIQGLALTWKKYS